MPMCMPLFLLLINTLIKQLLELQVRSPPERQISFPHALHVAKHQKPALCGLFCFLSPFGFEQRFVMRADFGQDDQGGSTEGNGVRARSAELDAGVFTVRPAADRDG
ncbi:hypothetical protein HMPREF1487_05495 [Pseudomonas sp. HPB0071]|uniref:Uncharacterized protein n=1 Tax=Pseudomonas luteola TaxID=47886 RepID=A0A2X2DHL9_PSELU|nr:hypothetical protein HMPREF1487_05495 [Pseudomonas sp. HPB0071]SPZ11695.1 Uncharacterised protein [Pseudomonas luteola]